MEKIYTKNAPDAIGPYSQAVKVNGFVFTSGQIAINPETGKVYLVKGLTQKWSEMFPWAKPPIVLEATLIPFCGCIISDGLVAPLRVSLGPGYKESFKQLYLEAKQSGKIITNLDKEP